MDSAERNEGESDAERTEVAEVVLTGLAQELIADGIIDSSGKNTAEVLGEAATWFRAHGDDVDFVALVTYEAGLLAEARRHVGRSQREFAIMMFATWMEHRLNYLITWGAKQRGLSSDEATELARSGIYQKTGILWKLVFADDLAPDIVTGVRAAAERRNAFVHYKWRGKSDGDVKEAAELDLAIELAERAIDGLDRIYITQVLRGFAG